MFFTLKSYIHGVGENKTISCILYCELFLVLDTLSWNLPNFNTEATPLLKWLCHIPQDRRAHLYLTISPLMGFWQQRIFFSEWFY